MINNKQRLFEMMERVNKINLSESISKNSFNEENDSKLIKKFISYVFKKLSLDNKQPKILISYKDGEAKNMRSFGKYTPNNDEILVVAKNRNLADTLRTLGHEIVHFKQKIDNKLNINSGDDGSSAENEANAMAAVFLREFGKNNPEIYE